MSLATITINLTKAATVHARAHQIRAHATLIALAKEQGWRVVFRVKCERRKRR
jgi:hypothetical protein